MGRVRAAAGSVLFLVLAPGVVGGLVPWLLTGWRSTAPPIWLRYFGAVMAASGALVLLEAFGRFALVGIGTPAPVAPTRKLVVSGLYRFVRNPMYLAVAAVILGQAALLGRWVLAGYAAIFGAAVWSFVHWYEEPTLRQKYGPEYEAYQRSVPGWLPRPRSYEHTSGGT